MTDSPVQSAATYAILPRVANAPHWVSKPKDPKFRYKNLNRYKYVDDEVNTSIVNMTKARLFVEDDVFFKEVVDLRTQGLLNHIKNNAEERGMSINPKKTGLMLVSAATSFDARVRVEIGGERITGSDKLKLLGVTIDNNVSFRTHVTTLAKRMRARSWALSKLKKKGLPEKNLIKTYYKCLIRPSVEYASPAWHSLLTATKSAEIERQQSQSLRNIFGAGLSANKMRLRAGVDTLATRRENAARKFALKSLTNERTAAWFPLRSQPVYSRRPGVRYPTYKEETSRTDRHRNSPKNFFIRTLNK